MDRVKPRVVDSKAFVDALTDAGIVHTGDRVRRVVVDAQVGCPLVIHIERYGDARTLNLIRKLEGVEVTVVEVGTQ